MDSRASCVMARSPSHHSHSSVVSSGTLALHCLRETWLVGKDKVEGEGDSVLGRDSLRGIGMRRSG